MRRAGMIGIAASALLATGVVTGGMLAVGQQLDVADAPGRQLGLQGVETGLAAQDSSGNGSGARIKITGTTPKVEVVVEQPVVDEVPPSDPVVIAPRHSAPVPQPAAPPPASKHGPQWGAWPGWGGGAPQQGPKHVEPPKNDAPKFDGPKHQPPAPSGPRGGGSGGGGHHGGGPGGGPRH